MTNWECLNLGAKLLEEAEIENARFDAMCLLQSALNLNSAEILFRKNEPVNLDDFDKFFKMIAQRGRKNPLQYILGKWEFYGFDFYVGEGVLIPRPDTEILVEYVENNPLKENPVVFDLCSGSGCIGISVAKILKNSTVYLSEKSEDAYKYILKNIELNSVKNVKPYCVPIPEIFSQLPQADIIISNPPYIKTGELDTLQAEVKKEPMLALDGGEDGLDFYRLLKEYAVDKLNDKGYIIVECGDTQAQDVAKIFSTNIILKDYHGIDRAVVFRKD